MQTNQERNEHEQEREFTSSLLALGAALNEEREVTVTPGELSTPVEVRLKKSILPLIVTLVGALAFPIGVQAQAIRDLPGFKARSVPRNDDGSSSFVALPFPPGTLPTRPTRPAPPSP